MPALKPNKVLALSCGDPKGIGAEITGKAWAHLKNSAQPFFVVGNPKYFNEAQIIATPEEAADCFAHALPLLPLDEDDALLALRSLELATTLTIDGRASALVTNPVNKARLAEVGFAFRGQTEYLAERTKSQALMMLATPHRRCALITTHLPLRDVPDALSTDKIIQGGRILEAALQTQFNIARPRIAVAALNPHAGDSGLLGDEETTIIAPACEALGDNFSAPLPADTMFSKSYDAYLCMFHDQALIPIKMSAEAAVNITLGLPIVRTSPDHGTAFDIAGKNIASPDSLLAAIALASKL